MAHTLKYNEHVRDQSGCKKTPDTSWHDMVRGIDRNGSFHLDRTCSGYAQQTGEIGH